MLIRQTKTVFAILAALLLVGCQNSESDLQAQATPEKETANTDVQTQSTSKNGTEAPLVLVEYADFQCPTCAYFYPIVEKLKKYYGDKLVVKFRYFPLNSHRYSMLAARAAEAAKNQGKFAAMKRLIFTNQDEWASSSNPQQIFIGYAREIGLNIKQFKHDLNAAETQRVVMEQKKKGLQRGVRATPTFFINGEKMITLPKNYKQFKALLDVYLKEAKKKASNG